MVWQGRVALCAAYLCFLTQAQDMESAGPFFSFVSLVELYGRTFKLGSSEYEQRRKIYEQRATEARMHNSRQDRLWTAGVSDLWDQTDEELTALRGWRSSARLARGSSGSFKQRVRATDFLE